jgi:hypothetical protein
MAFRSSNRDLDDRRRDLASRIARVRRRIDRRASKMTDRIHLVAWLGLGQSRSRGISLLAAFGIGVGLAGGFSRLFSPQSRQEFAEFWSDLNGLVSRCCKGGDAAPPDKTSDAAQSNGSVTRKDNDNHG